MRRFKARYLFAVLLAANIASAETFHRANGATSVLLAPICIPSIAGTGWASVDFNTTSLLITVIASGDAAYSTFNYTGANIVDGPTDFTWGAPVANTVKIDAIATGAFTGCIALSLRDEVFAVANSDKWTIAFSDSESALMDHIVEVLSPDVNITQINGNTTAATQLALSAATIESGAAEATPTTTVIQTNLAETQNDIYIGRVIIFTSGNARGEATTITDYNGSIGELTVTALANAPAASDTFVIL